MTGKERVIAAVRRKPYDRVPRWFWVGKGANDNLCAKYGLTPDQVDDFVGNDVKQCWLTINGQMERPWPEGESFVDEFGITWKRDGYYNMVTKHPMADLEADQIAAYPLPDPLIESRYEEFEAMKAKFGETHLIGADVSGSLFEPAYHLRGMDNILVDLALESDEATILLDRLCDFSSGIACEAARRGADWIWLGDDQGTQIATIMAPDTWRQWFKPRMKKIIDAVHEIKPDMIIAYHSCGAIFPIIGDLAEVGVNVLNPLQESATGMNHEEIKATFGDELTFLCGLDTQSIMVDASPEELKAAMKEKTAMLSAGGGYIAGVSHTLQHDIPAENIKAVIDALDEMAQ